MKSRLYVACLVSMALGQTQPGFLAGHVVDDQTAQPIGRATVRLSANGNGAQSYEITSDDSGNFAFQSVAPGQYNISAAKDGFLRTSDSTAYNLRVDIADAKQISDLTVKLTPLASIAGRITDQDDNAIKNAVVQITRIQFIDGLRWHVPTGSGRTNGLGEYRITNLKPGKYYIAAMPHFPADGEEGALALTFFAGVADSSAASQIDLPAGKELTSINFVMRKTEVVTVKGKVKDLGNEANGPEGQGGGSIIMRLSAGDTRQLIGENRIWLVDLPDGSFVLKNVRPGRHTLFASLGLRSGRLAINAGHFDLEDLVVPIPAAFNLNGIALIGDENPEVLKNVKVQLIPLEEVMSGSKAASLDKENRFTIQINELAKYHLALINLPQDYYLKSAYLGGIDVLEAGLDLSGESALNLELRIVRGAATVSGSVTVETGAKRAGINIVIAPEAPHQHWSEFFRTTTTDEAGNFQFTGLRPTRYRVYAFEKLDDGQHQDPEFLKQFEAASKSVRLVERGTEAVQLRVVPANQ